MATRKLSKPRIVYRVERSALWPLVLSAGFWMGVVAGMAAAAFIAAAAR